MWRSLRRGGRIRLSWSASDRRGSSLAVALSASCLSVALVKLVKKQINGNERVVLKQDATTSDLRIEANRLQAMLGYEVKPDGTAARYVATHPFYRGKYLLTLEPD